MAKQILVTGIDGQDGSYLTEALLARGDCVVGLVSRDREIPPPNLMHLVERLDDSDWLRFISGQLQDPLLFYRLLHEIQPEQIFHLAGVDIIVIHQPRTVQISDIRIPSGAYTPEFSDIRVCKGRHIHKQSSAIFRFLAQNQP